jgi:homocitrate synthase NifV
MAARKSITPNKKGVTSMTTARKRIKIVDTTLRDGEQTAGVVFSNQEKIRLARMLEDIGVDQIEVGIPAMGGAEKESIRAIAQCCRRASIMAWNRAVLSDLKHSLDCGVDAVAISIATSDLHIKNKLGKTREWVLESIAAATEFAKKAGLYVSINAEDASRSDFDFLVQFAKTGLAAGADRFRFCDTIGLLNPQSTYERIQALHQALPDLPIEMHTHNDFGLATANALAGVTAGATYVGVTINGLGERAGNAPLEEVVMALHYLYNYETGVKTAKLKELSEYAAMASGRPLPVQKAIVGNNIFTHESGIHVDGALKDPRTYEAFAPEEVGLNRHIIIGKHSGTAAIINKLHTLGFNIDEKTARELLPRVREYAVGLKRSLTDPELVGLYQDLLQEGKISA